jgi:hypothetical protein
MKMKISSGLSIIVSIFLLTGIQKEALAQTIEFPQAQPVVTLLSIGAASIGITPVEVLMSEEVPVVEQKAPSVQDILSSVCASRGYGDACAKTLLGMAWKESNFKAEAKGDFYRGVPAARGWFQIHYKLHKIVLECAEDLTCSANWTLDYMEKHSYPRYVSYAVQCHNSCNAANGYAASALRHGNRLWDDVKKQEIASK